MLVEDLIKQLEKLPKGSTIGTVDMDASKVYDSVSVVTNESYVYNSYGDKYSLKEIEKGRKSNKGSTCDFYIV